MLRIWTSGELSEDFIIDVEKRFYVAAYNDQVVGTGMIDIETGQLDAIFVHPTRMRNGIGRKIVNHLEDIAIKHGLETLSLESTLNAAPFYRACGFEGNEIGKYHSPRGISLDCVPMAKHISPNTGSQGSLTPSPPQHPACGSARGDSIAYKVITHVITPKLVTSLCRQKMISPLAGAAPSLRQRRLSL